MSWNRSPRPASPQGGGAAGCTPPGSALTARPGAPLGFGHGRRLGPVDAGVGGTARGVLAALPPLRWAWGWGWPPACKVSAVWSGPCGGSVRRVGFLPCACGGRWAAPTADCKPHSPPTPEPRPAESWPCVGGAQRCPHLLPLCPQRDLPLPRGGHRAGECAGAHQVRGLDARGP